MLRELVPGALWTAEMPASKGGFEFGARMTAVRLPDGGLWLHSPIALTPGLRAALDAAGPVRALVAPSGFHYEHVREFAQAYPEARVDVAEKAAGALKGVRIDGTLGETPPAAWGGALEQLPFRGSRLYDEVVFFHPATRTLLLTDLLFNIPPERGLSTRVWARLLGVLGKPSMSRSFKLTLRDRDAARACVERILAWDFDRITLTHGDLVERGGREAFRAAYGWLLAAR